jgi:hypothetical protein
MAIPTPPNRNTTIGFYGKTTQVPTSYYQKRGAVSYFKTAVVDAVSIFSSSRSWSKNIRIKAVNLIKNNKGRFFFKSTAVQGVTLEVLGFN